MRVYEHPDLTHFYRRSWQSWKLWMRRRGSFRKLARYSACLSVVIGLAALNIALLHKAGATSGVYQPSDVLGQVDGNGQPLFDSNQSTNAPAPNFAGFGTPGTAVDTVRHRLFVADCFNGRTLVYNLDSSNNLPGSDMASGLPAYVIGQPDFISQDSTVSDSLTRSCTGIAFDTANNRLFVGDEGNNRVLVYDLTSGITNGLAASYVLGQNDFTSSGFTSESQSNIYHPVGLAYDSTNSRLFVSDNFSNRILVFDVNPGTITDGENAENVLGQPDFTTGDSAGGGAGSHCAQPNTEDQSHVCGVQGLAYDAANSRLFVADSMDFRVVVFDVNPGTITDGENASHVLGKPNFTTGGLSFTISQDNLTCPSGLGFDSTGQQLFVGEDGNVCGSGSQRLMVFDVNPGTISDGMNATYVLGQTNFTNGNCSVGGGLTFQNILCGVQGSIAFDGADNRLWVPDDESGRIMEFDLSGGISNGLNAIDQLGQVTGGSGVRDFDNPNADNYNLFASANLSFPTGTSVDTIHHRLFLSDCGDNRILVFNLDANNNLIDHFADFVLGQPDFPTRNSGSGQNGMGCVYIGVTADPANNRLFVADQDNSRVLVYDFSGGISDNMNAANVIGQPDFATTTAATTQAGLSCPQGIVYDDTGKMLFVSDDCDRRIMIYDLSSGISNGMPAIHELGEPDFTTASNNACPFVIGPTQSTMCGIEDLIYDPVAGNLYSADYQNKRILVFNLSGGITDGMNASHVLGQPDFTSSNANTTQNGLNSPESMGFDSKNRYLFVGDTNNSRVLAFDVTNLSDDMNAGFVLGQPDFTSGSSVWPDGLNFPEGHVAFDGGNNRAYVTDSGNERVLAYDLIHITTASLPAGTVGNAYNIQINKSGGQGTQTFSQSGSLPNGITFDTSTGTLSGTPTITGTFNIMVKATDDNGAAGAYSDTASYSLTITGASGDTTPPSTPTGLHITATSCSSISLAWNASTDNVGVVGYYVYRDGGGTPIASTVNTTYTDTGLAANSTHSYTVTAYDAANNESARSASVSGTTSTCGGSTPPSTPPSTKPPATKPPVSPPTTPPTTPPTLPPIDLNSVPPATTSGVCSNVGLATAGQIYTFTARDGSDHKVTILQVGPDAIVVQIDNLPKTLHVGDIISQDVNGDGIPDICIEVISITGGNVQLKIDRIIFATAPGGHTSSGFGAGNSQGKHKTPLILKLIFPWLLFILLGLSALRLAWQSYKERRLASLLQRKLEAEQVLAEEKNNFVTLSSHYLRTPMASIAGGVELIGGLSPESTELKSLSDQLNNGIHELLNNGGRLPSQAKAVTPGAVLPSGGLVASAAGFIKVSSLSMMAGLLAGTFVAVSLADYILKHTDIYNISLVNFLTQLAGMLAIAIFFWAALRSHRKSQGLRQQAEALLASQRELDASRDLLVKNSLSKLKGPLASLKLKLEASAADPRVLKPALGGVAQLEGLLGKFTILANLETASMETKRQLVDVSPLAEQVASRYAAVLAAKNLKLVNQVGPRMINQDSLLVSFVIDSLLSNAIKYSPAGGQIKLASRHTHKGLEIYVQDQGPGIDPAKQSELFQPFSRAENTGQNFNIQGIGLSLFLDKLIINYLGGEINLESQAGHGTRIGILV